MKFTMDYTGGKDGFSLKQDLEIDIERDAEAIGYITSCLFETAKVLADYMEKVNPKFHERMSMGVAKSMTEKERENNPHFPFTTFIVQDEV